MLKAKKEIKATKKKSEALKEVSKGREKGFYALIPASSLKKINTYLAQHDITKKQWLENIIKGL